MLDMCTMEELNRPSSMGDRPAHYAVTWLHKFPMRHGMDDHELGTLGEYLSTLDDLLGYISSLGCLETN